jgi:hypothetical protein
LIPEEYLIWGEGGQKHAATWIPKMHKFNDLSVCMLAPESLADFPFLFGDEF